jgi:hypothetical protein
MPSQARLARPFRSSSLNEATPRLLCWSFLPGFDTHTPLGNVEVSRKMLDERALATVTDYDEMIGALRARMAELGVTNETIGAIAGRAGDYVGKLLAPSRIKNLGPMSFGVMLQSLGLKLIVVEDAETSAKMRPRWAQRKKALPIFLHAMASSRRATWLFTSRSGRKAAHARAKKLSAAERRAIGLNAIQVRWERHLMKKSSRAQTAKQEVGAHV